MGVSLPNHPGDSCSRYKCTLQLFDSGAQSACQSTGETLLIADVGHLDNSISQTRIWR